MPDTNRLIIWGCGRLGSRVGRLWTQHQPGQVIGYTQTTSRHDDLRAQDITPALGSPAADLRPTDHLLLALPGHETQHEALSELISKEIAPPVRTVIVSSTGYYGHPVYGKITAETPPGSGERAQRIAQMELTGLEWANGRGVVLRFGGLYTTGSGLRWAKRAAGQPYERDPDTTLSLIHYDDAATATYRALVIAEVAAAYVGVVPPLPTRRQFYTQACRNMDAPLPIFPEPSQQEPARYRPDRFLAELLPEPEFPNWDTAVTPSSKTQ